MNSEPLISRKRHYFYVLVFSVAAWLFIAMLIGGFVPLQYMARGHCSLHAEIPFYHEIMLNVSFIYYGIGGIVAGILLSYPLHRFILVNISQPKDKQVQYSFPSRVGRSLLGWKALPFVFVVTGFYLLGDYITHKFFVIHPNDKFDTRLGCAFARGDTKQILSMLQEMEGNDWNGVFTGAVVHGNTEIMDLAISKGAEFVNGSFNPKFGMTALHWAAMRGHTEIVKALLNKGIPVDIVSSKGNTPLHYASARKHLDVAVVLIEKGANVNARNISNNTPLHNAHFNHELVKLLVENGADVKAKDKNNNTPLHNAIYWAMREKNNSLVIYLLENGADPNVQSKRRGIAPLHEVAQKDNMELAGILIKHGADVNSSHTEADITYNSDGVVIKKSKPYLLTPLDYANSEEMKNLLRVHGGKTGEELEVSRVKRQESGVDKK